MKNNVLIKIPKYKDLKKLNNNDLKNLAFSIREAIIELSNFKNIHLSSNLGIVELSIVLLYLYDSPNDKIIYDTSHQCYTHKMLTDRFDSFNYLKETKGISGFLDNRESNHDFCLLGHSGNSISIASGAKENDQKDYVVVIGDASISNGIAFEALNNIAFNKSKILIVINDNGMSISENVGQLSKMFRKSIKINRTNKNKFFLIKKETSNIEYFFRSLGFEYIGAIDGNNIDELLHWTKIAKDFSKKCPTILHVKTIKGLGLIDAEKDKIGEFHSSKKNHTKAFTYGEFAALCINKILDYDNNIIVYNPGMIYSSGFLILKDKHPNNIEDTGISESHTISKAVGAALVNKKVYINIYSTFLQRAYDNLIMDIARMNLPITILIDRADISYGEGSSHHGIYDVSMLKSTNSFVITSPSNELEMKHLINFSYLNKKKPFAIRYCSNQCNDVKAKVKREIKYGEWIWVIKKIGSKKCIITYGHIVNEFLNKINDSHDFDLINAWFLTDYNLITIKKILSTYRNIFVVEKVIDQGCLANDLIDIAYSNKINTNIHKINIKNNFVEFGSKYDVNKKLKLDIDDILKKIVKTN